MSDAVLAHGGTLVTYTGDGMMAVFGAPLPQPDHADRALATARDMLEVRLPAFNEWLAEQGHDYRFKMGVGLNSGDFMSGNVDAGAVGARGCVTAGAAARFSLSRAASAS